MPKVLAGGKRTVLTGLFRQKDARAGEGRALGKLDERKSEDVSSAYRRAAPILDGVYQLVGAVLLGSLGGWWLDEKLGTSPWLVIGGSILGIASGMTIFLRAALAVGRKKKG